MKPVATWQHAGLLVSASPLEWVVLAPTGLHGVHRVTVAAESAAAAKQLLAKLMQGVLKPGIFAVYSEETESTRRSAAWPAANRPNSAPRVAGVSIPNVDERYMEDKVRAEPEMIKRTGGGAGTVRHPLPRG